MKNNNWIEEFIEKGADLEHDRWAKWQDYLHSKLIYHEIPSGGKRIAWYLLDAGNYEHWTRQINTDYKDLSEKEKESDRIEVRKYLPLIQEILTKKDQEHKAELESIKEELWQSMKELYRNATNHKDKEIFDRSCGYNDGLVNSISILDSHINKLSTE